MGGASILLLWQVGDDDGAVVTPPDTESLEWTTLHVQAHWTTANQQHHYTQLPNQLHYTTEGDA